MQPNELGVKFFWGGTRSQAQYCFLPQELFTPDEHIYFRGNSFAGCISVRLNIRFNFFKRNCFWR